MSADVNISMDDILKILPHRPPFLFVDSVVKIVPDKMIVCQRELRPDEPHFVGHFPSRPIMPGVLVADALAQTSGLLWGLSKKMLAGDAGEVHELFFLASVAMKFTHPAKPGDILRMTAHKDRMFGSLFTYDVEAVCGRNCIARGSLTLAVKEGVF